MEIGIYMSNNAHIAFLCSTEVRELRVKRPPYKKDFQSLKAYNSKTKCSRTKLTRVKHA